MLDIPLQFKSNVVYFDTKFQNVCAVTLNKIDKNNNVGCWGNNDHGQKDVPKDLFNNKDENSSRTIIIETCRY